MNVGTLLLRSLPCQRSSKVAAFSRLPSVMSARQIAVRGTPGGTECD